MQSLAIFQIESYKARPLDSGFRRSDVAVISYAIALACCHCDPVLDTGVAISAP